MERRLIRINNNVDERTWYFEYQGEYFWARQLDDSRPLMYIDSPKIDLPVEAPTVPFVDCKFTSLMEKWEVEKNFPALNPGAKVRVICINGEEATKQWLGPQRRWGPVDDQDKTPDSISYWRHFYSFDKLMLRMYSMANAGAPPELFRSHYLLDLKYLGLNNLKPKLNPMADEILPRITSIISHKLGVDESEVKFNSSLSSDLGADSLDLIEIIMDIESEFQINIDETELPDDVRVEHLQEAVINLN